MSLTVGTTLQNDKLVIEAILHQSDFGVTYQAAHPSINRPIILQSFNEVLRQRSDFDQLRQKFLQEVLLCSKQPSDTVQVIDCFEENGMPFVVLESVADQSIPLLSGWLEIPLEAPAQEITQITTEAAAAPLPTLNSLPLPDYATNGSRNGVKVLVSAQSLKPKNWMPQALMMTALITGFGGVGLGLALRFKPTPQGDNTSNLSSGWFEREQSFPPQQEWPITETPNLYPPRSAFEQPLYQTSPPVRDSGIPRVQPPTDYIPPAQLAPPDYQPAPPKIPDYSPPIPEPIQSAPAPIAEPPLPEVTQPVIPLPPSIIPAAPPETAPEISKPPPSDSKNVPADAPIIFRQ
jgi:hypothetical protein